jgi:hypothetical protein
VRRSPKLAGVLLLAAALMAAMLLVGCDGGFTAMSSTASPAGTSPLDSTITVIAAADNIQHQVTVTLNLRE